MLPSEYTKIPKQNNWHMESEEGNVGQIGEPKKGQSSLTKNFLHNLTDPGFPQAFSQWRVLTVFLHPDPRADQASKKQLDVKIDQGVRALADAFAPWDIPGRSITTRNESLRRILQLASDAGLMLFAQQARFTQLCGRLTELLSESGSPGAGLLGGVATVIANQERIIANQEKILANQETILAT